MMLQMVPLGQVMAFGAAGDPDRAFADRQAEIEILTAFLEGADLLPRMTD
ncbi:MAG TPA: hypothetical protein VEW66_00135 [Thermomicrobiales bacterium]|nr:hypothetical protein [Thermomicrobiales bacterium]